MSKLERKFQQELIKELNKMFLGSHMDIRYRFHRYPCKTGAEPIITEFKAPASETFYNYTQIYTVGSEIPPLLDVTVRIIP